MATQEMVLCAAHGNVKFSGYNHGTQSWKMGRLEVIEEEGGRYVCRMSFNAGYPRTFTLSDNIKKSCTFVQSNPGRCMIHLKDTNVTISAAPAHQVSKLIKVVNALRGPKTPCRPLNGLRKSPSSIVRSTPSWTGKSPSVGRKTPMSQSRLFSQVGGDREDGGSPINIKDFEKEPITKVPLFLDEDEDNVVNKENMGEVGFVSAHGSSIKKTPLQMRKEQGGNLFLQSAEEKLNLLREKKNDQNQISSFYGKGQTMSAYASADRFKNAGWNVKSSPKYTKYTPAGPMRPKGFSFKPKTSAAKFVPKTNPYQTKALQGFSNLGNTCYMNAILQSLYGLDGFRDQLVQSESSENIPTDSLSHAVKVLFVAKLQNKPRDKIRHLLLRVKNAISKSATRFSGYLQHDAQEFLCQCMDQLKEDTERLNKSLSELMGPDDPQLSALRLQSPTAGNLEFTVMHTIQCLECGEMVDKAEIFHDLSLDMPRRSKSRPSTIQVALDQFLQSEEVEYSCEKCQGREARLSHKFTKLSRYLILNLKRYVYNLDSSTNGKVQESIEIPKFLTLSRHCVSTVAKPGGQKTPTDEAVIALPSSPRRKLSFDAPDQNGYGHRKRQRLEVTEVKESSDEGDPVSLISDIDSGEEKSPENDFSKMTEEEQMAYVLKLSESETSLVPLNPAHEEQLPSTHRCPLSTEGDRTVPSLTDPVTVSANHMSEVDPNVPEVKDIDAEALSAAKMDTTSESRETEIRGGGMSVRGEGKNVATFMESEYAGNAECNIGGGGDCGESGIGGAEINNTAAEETKVVDSSAEEDRLPRQLEEGVVRFQVDSDSSAGEAVYQVRGDGDFVSPDRGESASKQPGETAAASSEDLKAKEEEQLKKATELSLQDHNNAALQEEEQIRKAQELSLQEYQRSSPPSLLPEVQEENPEAPLYTEAEWRQLEQNAKEGDMPNTYQLVSVVNHMGSSLSVGHYVSDVYDSKSRKWLSYDDSNVMIIPAAKVREDRRRTGYIFFYEKVS